MLCDCVGLTMVTCKRCFLPNLPFSGPKYPVRPQQLLLVDSYGRKCNSGEWSTLHQHLPTIHITSCKFLQPVTASKQTFECRLYYIMQCLPDSTHSISIALVDPGHELQSFRASHKYKQYNGNDTGKNYDTQAVGLSLACNWCQCVRSTRGNVALLRGGKLQHFMLKYI